MKGIMKNRLFEVMNFGLLALLWADFLWIFSREWSRSEQYQFGFVVPFLAAYALYLRFSEPPEKDHSAGYPHWMRAVAVGMAALIPVRVILGANPEWRFALWAYAIVIVIMSCALFGAWGGRPWVRQAFPVFLLMLFAVPWPTMVERPLTDWMSLAVAETVTSGIGFAGHYAVRQGSIIELIHGTVGVEEACSGIRSLQSSIMGAYFIGEVFRWGIPLRALFILAGAVFAFALNLIRTFVLTGAMISGGPEAADRMHDWLGAGFSILAFVVLLLLGAGVNALYRPLRRAFHRPPRVVKGDPDEYPVYWPGPAAITRLALVLVLGHVIAVAWFFRPGAEEPKPLITFDWQALGVEPAFPEIAPTIRNQLRYSEGYHAQWEWDDEDFALVYAFRWDAGRISSFAGVHRPETCLPATGFVLRERRGAPAADFHGREVRFDSYLFDSDYEPIFVFFAVWDEVPGRLVPVARGWRDRLLNTWKRLRVENRHSVQVVLAGPRSFAEAEQRFRRLMNASLARGEESETAFSGR